MTTVRAKISQSPVCAVIAGSEICIYLKSQLKLELFDNENSLLMVLESEVGSSPISPNSPNVLF